MKKTLTIPALFLMIIIISFSGCKSKDQKKNIAKIDSVISKMDSVYIVFNRLKFEKIKSSYELYTANADFLKENFTEIRTDENWPLMCAYSDVRKPIKTAFQNYYIIKNEIDTCEKQMKNLKHDISEGIINNKDFTTYFSTESQFAKNAVDNVKSKLIFAERYIKKFDSLHPIVNKLIEDFKNKPANKNDKRAKK
jgi:translation initiation factor 2B subunit (eIF-2B alpha/beta/delta family)